MGKLVLVTGGARSGKSSFGEKYAAKYGKRVAYIATSQIWDKEMEFRVKLHKEMSAMGLPSECARYRP